MKYLCKDAHEREGCLIVADDQYTMDFTDVEPDAYIRWCSFCGPWAHAMHNAIQQRFATDPGFSEAFEKALDDVE